MDATYLKTSTITPSYEIYGVPELAFDFDGQPEKELLVAMLNRACADLACSKEDNVGAKVRREAIEWLYNSTSRKPWSVMWIIECLSDYPEHTYKLLMDWVEKRTQTHKPRNIKIRIKRQSQGKRKPFKKRIPLIEHEHPPEVL